MVNKVNGHLPQTDSLNDRMFQVLNHKKLWKILEEMGIPDHLNCLLRNLYAGQKATVRTLHGTMGWLKIGKSVWQGYLFVTLFNLTYVQSTSCWAG